MDGLSVLICIVSKQFDTLIVFLKEFYEKVNFEKSHSAADDKTSQNELITHHAILS